MTEIRLQRFFIKKVITDFGPLTPQHRHSRPITGFQRFVSADIDNIKFERPAGFHGLQRPQHIITEMTAVAQVDL